MKGETASPFFALSNKKTERRLERKSRSGKQVDLEEARSSGGSMGIHPSKREATMTALSSFQFEQHYIFDEFAFSELCCAAVHWFCLNIEI